MKNNISKKAGTIVAVVVLCLIVSGFLNMILIPYLTNGPMRVCIFCDISECENLGNYNYLKIQKYDTPDKDIKLNELEYAKFHAAKYISSEFEFEIFAYEFKYSKTAKKYFKNIAKKDAENDTDFLGFGGASSYTLVVIDGKNAYSLYTDIDDRYGVSEIVYKSFSMSLIE